MPKIFYTILLLVCSNTFMTFAWYGHLKKFPNTSIIFVILISWTIALGEYCFQVPANRYGFEQAGLNLAQLKIIQEVITLSVFIPFAILYMGQKMKLYNLKSYAKAIILLCLVQNIFATNESSNDNYNSTLWYRTSAEKNALYREIFQMSKPIVLKSKKTSVKPGTFCGVVFDIDETLLDNSQFSSYLIKNNEEYNEDDWIKFIDSEVSTALPGARDITNYLHSIGCKVNLISNRKERDLKSTIDVLNREHIYYDQVLLAESGVHDKNVRFKAIADGIPPSKYNKKQTIIAYYGDNIQDFPDDYQKTFMNIDINGSSYDNFGVKYFVLPNPTYGSWQKNEFKYN